MIGWLVIAGYIVLAIVLWPWGVLVALAHLLVLMGCIPWDKK